MSIESAKAFLERIKSDEDFRKKVLEIATEEERMEYVKTTRYEFTNEELGQVQGQLRDEEMDELRNDAGRSLGFLTRVAWYGEGGIQLF